MKNLESFGVQELNTNEAINIAGGCEGCDMIVAGVVAVGNAIVEAGKWVLGLFAGMADGISDGLKD